MDSSGIHAGNITGILMGGILPSRRGIVLE